MTPEQKQRAIKLIAGWRAVFWRDAGNDMAALLQEMIDAPVPEPVARVTGYYGGYLSIATVDGRVLPAGTALYAAPPHQSEQHLEMVNAPAPSVPDADLVRDAERYRWLRNPDSNPAKVIDKLVSWAPLSDDGMTGGYGNYEYRAGEELDSAIDAAIAAEKGGTQ